MKKILLTVLVVVLIFGTILPAVGCNSKVETGEKDTNGGSSESLVTTDASKEEEKNGNENGDGSFTSTLADKGVKSDGTAFKVGLMYADLESEYIIYQSEYSKFMLEAAGCEVTIVSPDQNTEKEDSYVDDFIEAGVDCVALTAVDSNGSTNAMKKLNDAGIPVVCIARTVEGAEIALFVSTSDNVKTGEKCMQHIAELANGENVSVISVQGYMGASDAYLREEGYENILSENTNISYTPNPCDWTATKAESAVVDAITANPDLWGIASHSDAMTAGVYSALRQSNKAYKVGEEGHVVWCGIDGAAVALDMIRQGYMDSVVDQSPLANAVTVVKGILEYLVPGKELPLKEVNVETTLVTADNVDEDGWWGDYDINDTKQGIEWAATKSVWDNAEF